MASSVSDLPVGLHPVKTGRLDAGADYTAELEVYSLNGSGAAVGLTDKEIKRLRVTVHWADDHGPHQCQAELCQAPR